MAPGIPDRAPRLTAPTLSVIIPAINEAGTICRAINSAWQSGADEVIVADGGSTDDTIELAQRQKAITVSSDRGRAKQQNTAAELATGVVLLFLHADNALDPECVNQVRTCYQGGGEAGAFRQKIEAPTIGFRWLETGNAFRVKWRRSAYGDQGIFVQRDLFCSIGGFPDEPLLEDLLLMEALRKDTQIHLLPGPIYVSPRRWQRQGIVRQTLLNWSILWRHARGATPSDLVARYRRHDS